MNGAKGMDMFCWPIQQILAAFYGTQLDNISNTRNNVLEAIHPKSNLNHSL